jgi:hypothetical protein
MVRKCEELMALLKCLKPSGAQYVTLHITIGGRNSKYASLDQQMILASIFEECAEAGTNQCWAFLTFFVRITRFRFF